MNQFEEILAQKQGQEPAHDGLKFINHFTMKSFLGDEETATPGIIKFCEPMSGQRFIAGVGADNAVHKCVELIQQAQFRPEDSRIISQRLKHTKKHKSDYEQWAGMPKSELIQFIKDDAIMGPILRAVLEVMRKASPSL